MANTFRKPVARAEDPEDARWTRFLVPAVFLRSAIVAFVIGIGLTMINQAGWVFGLARCWEVSDHDN